MGLVVDTLERCFKGVRFLNADLERQTSSQMRKSG